MKKLISLLTLICGCIALSQSQALSASRLSRSVEDLRIAEGVRQGAIQDGYNHLPNTYDIIQRLVKVNPRVRANKIEKEVIARSLIANAEVVLDFRVLVSRYMILGHTLMPNLMAYLSISAITHCLKDGENALTAKGYFRYLQSNNITKDKRALFERMVEKYSRLTKTLYKSVSQDLVTKPERDCKEEKSHVPSAQTAALPPQYTAFKPRPYTLWEFYPQFYQAILTKIKPKTRIDAENIVEAYMSAIGPLWPTYNQNNLSLYLVSGRKNLGLSETDINKLMQMFSLVIPQAPDRWVQIKRQAATDATELKATFKGKLVSLVSCREELTSGRILLPDFFSRVSQMYYTYMFLDENELYALLTSDEETLVMSQQMNIIVQQLIFNATGLYFEHRGILRAFFQQPVIR